MGKDMKMLYRENLDQMKCNCERCKGESEEVWLHSKCHNNEPTWAYYQDGVLTIVCAACDKVVAKFAVRDREEVMQN